MTRIDCSYWADCPPAGCCGAGVYTHPTVQLCGFCLAHGLVKTRFQKVPPQCPLSGAGTELKKLLAKVGITAKPNCSCNKRAHSMDAAGPDWCEQNIVTIVGWLREEAAKRKLPFVDMAAKALVRLAIARARRIAHSR